MKRIAWMIGLVLPLALLSGCAVTAPELPKSSTKPPEKFVAQNILQNLSSVKDAGVAGVRWWEGFNDSVLNELVSTSIQNNFQIASAAARVREARALLQLSEAGDSLLVELDAEVSGQKSDRAFTLLFIYFFTSSVSSLAYDSFRTVKFLRIFAAPKTIEYLLGQIHW